MVLAGARATSGPLTSNQKRGFLAAWGGWALDGMDSFIYALVLVPALMELLPAIGDPADAGQYRSVRRTLVRALPVRVGHLDGVGPHR